MSPVAHISTLINQLNNGNHHVML